MFLCLNSHRIHNKNEVVSWRVNVPNGKIAVYPSVGDCKNQCKAGIAQDCYAINYYEDQSRILAERTNKQYNGSEAICYYKKTDAV